MVVRKPVDGNVTAPWDDPRPFGSLAPDHVHGGIDIGADVGDPIVSPETGVLRAYLAVRYKERTYWPEQIAFDGEVFPYRNYFYDMFGGVLVLQSDDGERTHLIAHCYGNQLFDRGPFAEANVHWIEEKAKERWPIHAIYTDTVEVEEGEEIGFVGDSGFSTGPHIHWEIHHGYQVEKHIFRLDPERWLREEA